MDGQKRYKVTYCRGIYSHLSRRGAWEFRWVKEGQGSLTHRVKKKRPGYFQNALSIIWAVLF